MIDKIAHAIDRLRIAPRLFVVAYGWMLWDVVQWFMTVPTPTNAHTAFVVAMTGVAGAIFNFYVKTGCPSAEK